MADRKRASTAVMQRRLSPPGALDFFPTPPWATRALIEFGFAVVNAAAPRAVLPSMAVWDPVCGERHMSRVLAEWFDGVLETDVHAYGDHLLADFLDPLPGYLFADTQEWIVMNPPFSAGVAFVNLALARARIGVAVLARGAFSEGQDRYRDLFSRRPPDFELQFVERVPMHKGRWVVNGSTATSYVWLIWLTGLRPHAFNRIGTRKVWIPPCRQTLSRPDDPIRFNGWYRYRNRDKASRVKWLFRPAAEHLQRAA